MFSVGCSYYKTHIFHFSYKMSYSQLFSLDIAKQLSRTCSETDKFLPYMGNILIFPRPYLKSVIKCVGIKIPTSEPKH